MDSPREKWANLFLNAHNKWQFFDENYHVYFKHSGENGPGKKTYWMCEHPGCKRLAIVQDDKIIHTPEHHHRSNQYRLDARLAELAAIEKAGEDLTIKPSIIIDELKGRLCDRGRVCLNTDKSIIRRIRKRRAEVKKAAKAVNLQTQPDIPDGSSAI